jgi:hypothetical protein
MAHKITLVFELGDADPLRLLELIKRRIAQAGITLEGFALNGKPMNFQRMAQTIKQTKRSWFAIQGQGLQFDLSSIKNFEICSLCVEITQPTQIVWNDWVLGLVKETFILAWLADVDYDYWQNAHDPLQYAAQGRSCDGLPMISNGLPPPLVQAVVDISRNPGRRILRVGFIEAVGSTMWLGDKFWGKTNANRGRVKSANFLRCTELTPHVLRIEAAPAPFSTDQGPSGNFQRELRALLFPS